jgi:vacuolar-type H+-ATPase subunit I/STV1
LLCAIHLAFPPPTSIRIKNPAAVPILLFYGKKEFVMTTILTSTPLLQGGKTDGPQGDDPAAQIARITKKISELIQKLKDIPGSNASVEEKKKQQELLQMQIKVLQAQLAQLMRKQAEEAQQKQDQKAAKDAGAIVPVGKNQIDVYI